MLNIELSDDKRTDCKPATKQITVSINSRVKLNFNIEILH